MEQQKKLKLSIELNAITKKHAKRRSMFLFIALLFIGAAGIFKQPLLYGGCVYFLGAMMENFLISNDLQSLADDEEERANDKSNDNRNEMAI